MARRTRSGTGDPSEGEPFKGEVRVASRIIDFLSSGLYESPAACLKELINNAYDADATDVSVFVMPDADRIIVEDNGVGISRDEFQAHFQRIAESHKRDTSEHTASGRPKIGRIGIGVVAANEICEVLEFHSTKRGSRERLVVALNFYLMRLDAQERRRKGDDFAKGDYTGEVFHDADPNEHYTKLFLLRVKGRARDLLAGATNQIGDRSRSLYGLKDTTVADRLREVGDWDSLDLYSQTMLNVAMNVPVRYHPTWVPPQLKPKVKKFEEVVTKLGFTVLYDGTELRKPIVFDPPEDSGIWLFEYKGDAVAARGYFYAQRNRIKPKELQGVLIRIRNAAVGDYDNSFLDFPGTRYPLFQSWLSAEVWADDGLEDAMNIDRRSFRTTHPAFVELQAAFHARLGEVFREVRETFYAQKSQERHEERAVAETEKIARVIRETRDMIGGSAAQRLERAWTPRPGDRTLERNLLRKYTVGELYRVVVDAARETLDEDSFRAFIEELDRRLRQR